MKKLFRIRQVIWINGFGYRNSFFGNFDIIVEANTKEQALDIAYSNYTNTIGHGPKYLKQFKFIRISKHHEKDFYECKKINQSYGVDMDLMNL
jgi:hypothetical protein